MTAAISRTDRRKVLQVPEHDARAVAGTTDRLRAAQPAWEALGVAGRSRWLRRYRNWLVDNADELARTLQAETGKVWPEAHMEVPIVAETINFYLARAPKILAARNYLPQSPLTLAKRQVEQRRPYAVVGNIAPWNFPVALSLMDGVPALLAGAAVVIKPSELTPLAVSTAVFGWDEIGAPPVLACVTGGSDTGAAVVDAVDYIQFTGSSTIGRLIAQRAGERLVPCSLELGGKDAMLVLADADLERAANAAVWGAFCNAGQMCTSVERVYVEAPAYERFVELVVARTNELRTGHPTQDFSIDVGPMVNQRQVEIVTSHIRDAQQRGASVLVGGNNDGLLVEPTVLVNVDHTMTCMLDETFGPTLPIMRVADADEAVALANDSRYGLSASVFTNNPNRAKTVAAQLEVGAVTVNDVFGNLVTMPLMMSGWKTSGLGSRLGDQGLLKYTRSQAVVTARFTPTRELAWYPYSAWRTGPTLFALRHLVGRLGVRPR